MRLNLGCGADYRAGWINVDKNDVMRCDVLADLSVKLPFPDEAADEIVANHLIEHLPDLVTFMNECHRVLVPGGKLYLEFPKADTDYFWQDPTHVRSYTANTFTIYFMGLTGMYGIRAWSGAEVRQADSIINDVPAHILSVEMVK